MRYLLDTHTFLWLATDDPQLTPRARAVFADASHQCLLSAASVWEMAIKASLGKLELSTSLERLVQGGVARGIRLLDITSKHGWSVEHLPYHHRDPFDRMLIAQAIDEGLHIVSRDEQLDVYAVTRVWS